jgi:hypothetical protein
VTFDAYGRVTTTGFAANANHISVDGYTIDLSAGATSNQGLVYNGVSIVAGSVGSSGTSINDSYVTSSSPTTILTYTPTSAANFIIGVYYRVLTTATTLTITASYTSVGGSQTVTLIPNISQSVGEYIGEPIYFNSVSGQPITITATCGTANTTYISASIRAV